MKLFFLVSLISTFLLSNSECKQQKEQGKKYRGKLEIKGICMNYTISNTDAALDTSAVVAQWTDESSGKEYQNVFGLANPCDFPSTIKAGEEFSFIITEKSVANCMICMAYYPTPPKKLFIKVVTE